MADEPKVVYATVREAVSADLDELGTMRVVRRGNAASFTPVVNTRPRQIQSDVFWGVTRTDIMVSIKPPNG